MENLTVPSVDFSSLLTSEPLVRRPVSTFLQARPTYIPQLDEIVLKIAKLSSKESLESSLNLTEPEYDKYIEWASFAVAHAVQAEIAECDCPKIALRGMYRRPVDKKPKRELSPMVRASNLRHEFVLAVAYCHLAMQFFCDINMRGFRAAAGFACNILAELDTKIHAVESGRNARWTIEEKKYWVLKVREKMNINSHLSRSEACKLAANVCDAPKANTLRAWLNISDKTP